MCSVEVQNQLADSLADVGRQLSENMEILVGACSDPNVDVEALIGLEVVHGQRGRWLAEQVFIGCMTFCLDSEETAAIADNEMWLASSALLETHLRRPDPHRLYVENVIREFETAFQRRIGEMLMHMPSILSTRQ